MRSFCFAGLVLLLAFVGPGCGPKLLKTKGLVVKDGLPFTPPPEDTFRLTFAPDAADSREMYLALFHNGDGTFEVVGRSMNGMPAGKYRVIYDYKHDGDDESPLKKKHLGYAETPFVFEVDSDGQEIVIDLDQVPSPKSSAKKKN